MSVVAGRAPPDRRLSSETRPSAGRPAAVAAFSCDWIEQDQSWPGQEKPCMHASTFELFREAIVSLFPGSSSLGNAFMHAWRWSCGDPCEDQSLSVFADFCSVQSLGLIFIWAWHGCSSLVIRFRSCISVACQCGHGKRWACIWMQLCIGHQVVRVWSMCGNRYGRLRASASRPWRYFLLSTHSHLSHTWPAPWCMHGLSPRTLPLFINTAYQLL